MSSLLLPFDVIPVRDSHVLDVREQRRLTGQSLRILERLRQGPATRDDIAAIGRNPTARISDLRKYLQPQGLTVKCIEEDHKTGFSRYALVEIEGI
jgi:hypothetical protein